MAFSKRKMGVVAGKEKDAAMKDVEKARKLALKHLEGNTDGFALFIVEKDKRGKSKGVRTVMGGALRPDDAILLAANMHETSEEMIQHLMSGLENFAKGKEA